MLSITVEDTGIGISKEDQNKLFKLFGIIKSTRQMNTKGVGLGLCICQMITVAFGGKVTVSSQLNKGSSFSFYFMVRDK